MDETTAGSSYAQSQQLFHNGHDGTFAEDLHSLGDLVKPRVTRGLAVGDYDNDGDIDVLMVSQTGPLQLFRNDGGNAERVADPAPGRRPGQPGRLRLPQRERRIRRGVRQRASCSSARPPSAMSDKLDSKKLRGKTARSRPSPVISGRSPTPTKR